jgi:hypothetical protein
MTCPPIIGVGILAVHFAEKRFNRTVAIGVLDLGKRSVQIWLFQPNLEHEDSDIFADIDKNIRLAGSRSAQAMAANTSMNSSPAAKQAKLWRA